MHSLRASGSLDAVVTNILQFEICSVSLGVLAMSIPWPSESSLLNDVAELTQFSAPIEAANAEKPLCQSLN